MSNLPIAGEEDRKSSPKLDVPPLTEQLHTSQEKGMDETHSHTRVNPGESNTVKLLARDLLATLSRMRISTTKIEFIGNGHHAAGTYANVAVATLVKAADKGNEGKSVAVKMFRFIMREIMTEEKFLRVFVNELRLLDKLSHPNIAKIIGFVEDVEKSIAWLVFPWEDNGNLREYLRSGTWEIPERVSLIRDVASGLDYLHSRQPPVCHGDLKSLNILVNSSNRAVITDFGSARILRQTQEPTTDPSNCLAASASSVAFPKNSEPIQFTVTASETALTLTGPACSLRWAPPEVLNGEALDLAGDIWALGWIAWEALTNDYPFWELKLDFEVTMRIIEGRLPSIYGHDQLSQVRSLCSLMQSCWKHETKARPSATECLKTLRWIPTAIPTRKRGEESKLRSVVLLRQIGEMHRLQNRHEEASKLYEEGLSIARSTGDQSMVADLLVQLAQNQRGRFDFAAKAEAPLTEALTIFRRIGNDGGRANALGVLGAVQRHQSKHVEAEASFTEALAIYGRIGNGSLGEANTLRELGDTQKAQSKNVEAESTFIQALAIYESVGDKLGRANALRGLGDVRQARSEYVEAEMAYNQALAIFESIGNDRGRVNSAIGLSQIRFRQARYAEAKALINDTVGISERINYIWGINTSKTLLKQILEAERRSVEP